MRWNIVAGRLFWFVTILACKWAVSWTSWYARSRKERTLPRSICLIQLTRKKCWRCLARSFGKLSGNAGSNAEQEFLEEAVASLTVEDKVVGVQLALFAEMIKDRQWNSTTLSEVGESERLGLSFLRRCFETNSVNPDYPRHRQAAQNVLKTLLPDFGTTIKSGSKSSASLLEASGYASDPNEFETLVRILTRQLRLVKPVESDDREGDRGYDQSSPERSRQRYSLMHDLSGSTCQCLGIWRFGIGTGGTIIGRTHGRILGSSRTFQPPQLGWARQNSAPDWP